MPTLTKTDEQLMARVRRGCRESFALLVRRYEGELYGYLRRYLGDADLASDVFQNTFLAVFKKAGQYEAGRAVRPWLYTIATHQAIDAMRRLGRRPASRLDDLFESEHDENWHSLLASPGPGPLDRAETEERRRAVRASVEELPEFLRQVVTLAYFQELKHAEISEILGIPVGTVKSRLHTAITRLQEAWAAAPAT